MTPSCHYISKPGPAQARLLLASGRSDFHSEILCAMQALFMFPILMLGCIFVALCLAVLGARYTVRNLRRVWLRCDFAFSTFLLGQHAPAVAEHQEDHHQQHGFEEV